jgi:predicted ATP-grasp superfamily ATP-dependent carboligase
VSFDTSVSALVVKIGRYPLHHGGLAAIRSLGRVGVPVYAMTEDRLTPAALSRYCTAPVVAPTTGHEADAELLDIMTRVTRALPGPAIALPTDDESAVFLAEHARELSPPLLMPRVPTGLPRALSSKRGLRDLCLEHGFPTPRTTFPTSFADVEEFAAHATFPVVLKNVDPFVRLQTPAVPGTTFVHDRAALLALARDWPPGCKVALQEFVPSEAAEDWVFHGYFDANRACVVGFTGVKHRSWPPRAGVTAFARIVDNDELAALVVDFVKRLEYSGIVDLDIRYDRRDLRYKLLDFNPRPGAQFRTFENDAGIDVVRAMHLDLTGRPVPPGRQILGRRFVVEHLDLPAVLAYRRVRAEPISVSLPVGPVEMAWFSPDDPLPFVSMCARYPALLSHRVHRLARRARHRSRDASRREVGARDEPHQRSEGGSRGLTDEVQARH